MSWVQSLGLMIARCGGWKLPPPPPPCDRPHFPPTCEQTHFPPTPPPPSPCPLPHWPSFSQDLLVRTFGLILHQDTNNLHGSGENKRHLVYATLMKEFPTIPHAHLALTIEYVKHHMTQAP